MKTIRFEGQTCRAVPGFPDYWIPASGAFVVSTKIRNKGHDGRPTKLKTFPDKDGYLIARWGSAAGPMLAVHTAVLLAWRGPARGRIGRHLDDCKQNNALANLIWGTHADNGWDTRRLGRRRGEGNPRARLTAARVAWLRVQAKTRSVADLMRYCPGITRSAVRGAITGKSWRHLPGALRKTLRIVVNHVAHGADGKFLRRTAR